MGTADELHSQAVASVSTTVRLIKRYSQNERYRIKVVVKDKKVVDIFIATVQKSIKFDQIEGKSVRHTIYKRSYSTIVSQKKPINCIDSKAKGLEKRFYISPNKEALVWV